MTTDTAACDLARSRRSSVLLWGIPLLAVGVGILWAAARGPLWSGAFLVMGVGCVANAARCGRFHCYFTGPLFLGAGLLSLGNGLNVITVPWSLIGNGVAVGFVLAYVPEWFGKKYVRRGAA